jgi:hypothetical protein
LGSETRLSMKWRREGKARIQTFFYFVERFFFFHVSFFLRLPHTFFKVFGYGKKSAVAHLWCLVMSTIRKRKHKLCYIEAYIGSN